MLASLALIFIVGLASAAICRAVRLPRIIGMLLVGIVVGPYVLDFLNPSILSISSELRSMALVIILIKAGLSLNLTDLKKVGRPALLMSFVPALFELAAVVALAPVILHIRVIEAAIMGAVLAAVSPAVVVPRMVQLIDEQYGTNQGVPQLILAGASLDDVFVIVLFSTFVGIEQGNGSGLFQLINIPVSVILGIISGMLIGLLLSFLFSFAHNQGHSIRTSIKVILILGCAFFLVALEKMLEGTIALSGLLAVMSMAIIIQIRSYGTVTKMLSERFGQLWVGAEILLFVLVGAAVNIESALDFGLRALVVILLSLIVRSVGVLISLIRTPLNWKERLFCVISYLPKATVQAAIGGVPLALGLPCGNLVLSVAVLSILVTAPLGAIGMDLSYKHLLTHTH